MSLQPIDFDFDIYDPESSFEVVLPPAGEYLLCVTGVEDKAIPPQNNRMIEVHFEVATGEHAGKKFQVGYYIGNPNLNAAGFPEQATWAKQALGALYLGITGERLTNALWGSFEKNIFMKQFTAQLTITVSKANNKSYPKLSFKKKTETPQPVAASVAVPAWGK